VIDLLLWALACVLFLMALACFVIMALVNRDEHRYLFWAAGVGWAVLCLALGLVVLVGLL
jgi:hypothetical protein